MGKRSNFERRKNDAYETPPEGVVPLIPHLHGISTFAEPCAGDGKLVAHLERYGLHCVYSGDIEDGKDALTFQFDTNRFDAIITNPPWSRDLLHPMIERFQSIAPTWLLFDADWAHTRQAIPYLDRCSHIVSIGRLKWVANSPYTGKDNSAWYQFHAQHTGGPRFYPKTLEAA